VDSAASLDRSLGEAYERARVRECTLIEAVVSPHGAREQHARILAAINDALRDALPT
jgi:hypothetical protein